MAGLVEPIQFDALILRLVHIIGFLISGLNVFEVLHEEALVDLLSEIPINEISFMWVTNEVVRLQLFFHYGHIFPSNPYLN